MPTTEEIVQRWKQVHGKDPNATDIANVQKHGLGLIDASFESMTGKKAPGGTVNQQSSRLSISPAQGRTTKERLDNAMAEFQNLTSQEGLSIDLMEKLLTARRRERQPIEEEKQKIRERMVKRDLSSSEYEGLRPDDAIQAYSRDQNLDLTRGS